MLIGNVVDLIKSCAQLDPGINLGDLSGEFIITNLFTIYMVIMVYRKVSLSWQEG